MEQLSPQVYATERLKEGLTPEAIKQNLLLVGWSLEEANSAVVSGLIASGVPIPEKGVRGSQRKLSSTVEVVLNFFSFITLGVVAIALGTLYFQIVNHYFPDPLILRYGGIDASPETIHYATAALIITFPLYAFVVSLWFKRFRDDNEKEETRLTKWLTHLVLLVSAISIVGDLITAVFYLLQGEITARFFLKALTILVIAGIVFGFYFLERKKIQYHKNVPRALFQQLGWATFGLILVAIIFGFVVGGSPSTARKQGFDTQRSNDLRSLASCVANFGMNKKQLPAVLAELTQSGEYAYCSGNIADPESGAPYEYRIVTASAVSGLVREGEFELCANFALDSSKAALQHAYSSPADKWGEHGVGRNCDTEKADLERYQDRLDSSAPGNIPTAIPLKVR